MNLITKYIFNQLLSGVLIVTAVLTGVAWLTQIIRLLKYILERGLSVGSFLTFTSFLLPQLINIVLPIALFAVILFVYNRMVMDKELVVMHVSGASRWQLAKPAFILTGCLMVFSYFSSLYLEPTAAVKFKTFQWRIANDLSYLMLKEDKFNEVMPNLTIYVEKSTQNTLHNVIMFDNRQENNQYTIMAKKGMLIKTQNGISVALVSGSLQEKSKETNKYTFGYFDDYTIDLGLQAKKENREKRPKEVGLLKLLNPSELGVNEKEYSRFKIEAHRRLIFPLNSLIFTLIALLGIFNGSFTGRRKGNNLMIATGGFIAIEGLTLFLFSFFEKNIAMIGGLYMIYAVLIAIGFFALLYQPPKKRKAKKIKK